MNELKYAPMASEEDYQQAYALATEIWQVAYKGIISQEQIDYMLPMMYAPAVIAREIREGIVYEFALDGDKRIGIVSFGPQGDGVMKLHKLYLLPSYHGRGVGSQMLQHAIAAARAKGAKRLVLNVNKQNSRAIKAYKRNGFAVQADVKNAIGNSFYMDDYVMGLDL